MWLPVLQLHQSIYGNAGSLFASFPEGLEDVSKYPSLIQELLRRNWTEAELAGVLRLNFIRVLEEVERVSGVLWCFISYLSSGYGYLAGTKHGSCARSVWCWQAEHVCGMTGLIC